MAADADSDADGDADHGAVLIEMDQPSVDQPEDQLIDHDQLAKYDDEEELLESEVDADESKGSLSQLSESDEDSVRTDDDPDSPVDDASSEDQEAETQTLGSFSPPLISETVIERCAALGVISTEMCKIALISGFCSPFVPSSQMEPSAVTMIYLFVFCWCTTPPDMSHSYESILCRLCMENSRKWQGPLVVIPPRAFWKGVRIFSLCYSIAAGAFGALVYHEIISLTVDSRSETLLRYTGFPIQIWSPDIVILELILTFAPPTVIFLSFSYVQYAQSKNDEAHPTSPLTFSMPMVGLSWDDETTITVADVTNYATEFHEKKKAKMENKEDKNIEVAPPRHESKIKRAEAIRSRINLWLFLSMIINLLLATCNPCILALPNILFLFFFLNHTFLRPIDNITVTTGMVCSLMAVILCCAGSHGCD